MNDKVTETRYRVDGMDCGSCATKIETALERTSGVLDVVVSVPAGKMTLRHDARTDLAEVQRKVTSLGFTVSPWTPNEPSQKLTGTPGDNQEIKDSRAGPTALHEQNHGQPAGPWWTTANGWLTIGTGIGLAVAFAVSKIAPQIGPWAFVAVMLIGLIPIARRAINAALAGTPFSIEMLMTVAAVGAVVIGAAEEGATVVFLFLVGELLEGVAAGKARASIQSLAALVPKTALLEKDGKPIEVPAASLQIGSVIFVRPGDRISADGVIVDGESSIDEAPVTGESVPIRKGVDAKVFAGTINGDAALRVKVSAAAADNTIARVVKLVEEAQESKAPTERFIGRFSRWYTPSVVVLAILVVCVPPLLFDGLWATWIYKGLAILLIGCPCALVISTPAAIAAALSAGARRGLLLKGGAVLETLGTVTAVALDKTGTLTEGKPKVTDVVAFANSEGEVVMLAAALETGSSHPLASAILARAATDKISIPQLAAGKAIGGKGVSGTVDGTDIFLGSTQSANEKTPLSAGQMSRIAALNDQGKTVSVLLVGNVVAGAIAMRDEPRADARAGLKALTHAGIKIVMLTGDNKRTATAIGADLGIEVRAELLPEDKQRIVNELKSQGFVVAKVGDGINDAPALAAADVGIAMGGGTDVALETAGAAVLHGRVADVAAMIHLSKRTMRNIWQNITIALGLKAGFLVTTIIGLTGLWPAILADTGATVLVTINALRLLTPVRSSDDAPAR